MQSLQRLSLNHSHFNDCYYFRNTLDSSRQTLVFVHGFAENSFIWNNIFIEFVAEYNVIVIELPGSGESADCQPFIGLAGHAEYVLRILDQEQIKTCIYFGHSMGGYIGMDILQHHPARLSGFALIHSSAYADSPDKKAIRQKAIELIENGGKNKFYHNLIPNLYHESYAAQHPEQIDMHLTQAKQISVEWTLAYYKSMMERPDYADALSNYEQLCLIVAGANDGAVPLETSLKMSNLCNKTQVHILENCCHCGTFEHRQKLISIMQYYVANLRLL